MSRFGASPRPCPPAGGWLGRHAVWGKEGILPPASPRLGRARPTGSANPLSRFHIRVFLKILDFFLLITAALIRESGRPSGNVRGSNTNAPFPPPPSRPPFPPPEKKRRGGGAPPFS